MEGLWNLGQEKPLSIETLMVFCKSFKDKNIESSTDNGDLAYEISEGILNTLSGPFAILI